MVEVVHSWLTDNVQALNWAKTVLPRVYCTGFGTAPQAELMYRRNKEEVESLQAKRKQVGGTAFGIDCNMPWHRLFDMATSLPACALLNMPLQVCNASMHTDVCWRAHSTELPLA